MALIDKSFFFGNILIPNTDNAIVSSELDWYINQYEAQFLKDLMGYMLYQDFIANAYVDGELVEPLPAEWDKVVNGDPATGWKGLVYQPGPNPDFKKSPIANYVYYWFVYNNVTQSTGIGEVIANAENAARTSPAPKMVQAWNEMCDDVSDFWDYVQAGYPAVYTSWQTTHRYAKRRTFSKINEFNI